MSSAYSFSNSVSASVDHVTYDVLDSAPQLAADLPRFLLEKGVFTKGALKGQSYSIVIAHPNDVDAIHQVSETELKHERLKGKQNLKPRSKEQISKNLSINLSTQPESGGAVVMLLKDDNTLLAMGGVVLVDEPETAGRGDMFSKCDLDKQIVMNMAVTHPHYQGMGLTNYIYYHRLNIATLFSAERGSPKPREYVVVKVAGSETKEFYETKQGFTRDGHDLLLPDVAEPDNLLTTLGMTMDDICTKVQTKRPDIYANGLTLTHLHENNRATPTVLSHAALRAIS